MLIGTYCVGQSRKGVCLQAESRCKSALRRMLLAAGMRMLVPGGAAATRGGSVPALVARSRDAGGARRSQPPASPAPGSVLVPTPASPRYAGSRRLAPGERMTWGGYLQGSAQPAWWVMAKGGAAISCQHKHPAPNRRIGPSLLTAQGPARIRTLAQLPVLGTPLYTNCWGRRAGQCMRHPGRAIRRIIPCRDTM